MCSSRAGWSPSKAKARCRRGGYAADSRDLGVGLRPVAALELALHARLHDGREVDERDRRVVVIVDADVEHRARALVAAVAVAVQMPRPVVTAIPFAHREGAQADRT